MSLSVSLKTAASGLQAAQAGLRATSDNIANVNTPGYVRKAVEQRPLTVAGIGMGVEVSGVRRVTDQYLQLASLTAGADAARWSAVAQYLDTAQSLFGDPSSDSFFFNRLDTAYAAFAAAADDPSSSLLRSQAIAGVEDFLSDADRINGQINELARTMDTRIMADVSRANDLLNQINQLNTDISRSRLAKADAAGSENIQSQLLDELSALMSVRVAAREDGGVTVRSTEGVLLAGDGVAKLAYVRTEGTPGHITALPPGYVTAPQPIQLSGGEIRGLMDLRDKELPAMSEQLGEFVSRAVEQLNAAHNASSAFPAPASLTGRNTGLDLVTAIKDFAGTSTVAIVNAAGVVQRKVAIDFTAGTLSVDGGAAAAFAPGAFLTSLNTALGGFGSASFAGGQLSLTASAGNGLAVDAGTSQKAGKTFAHFFGLNDLVRSSGFTSYETGLTATSLHGYAAGSQLTFRLAQPDGKPIRDVTVTVPAGTTMADLMSALNHSATGVGLYGAFTLDPRGAMSFAGGPPMQAQLSILTDTTQRGAGGPSISQLFGLGGLERTARAGRFNVDQALVSDPGKLALGRLDLTVGAGQAALRPGDGRGALALSLSGDVATGFQAAGSLGVVTMTVSRYAAEFGGSVGRAASAAETHRLSAEAVQTEATARRQSVEGVNLDEELVHLTTYQQAFNASARMVQAAKDLFDVLIAIV